MLLKSLAKSSYILSFIFIDCYVLPKINLKILEDYIFSFIGFLAVPNFILFPEIVLFASLKFSRKWHACDPILSYNLQLQD